MWRDGMNMEIKDRIKELRESTGMNRKEFCEYFGIPYRTVTEWESVSDFMSCHQIAHIS